MNAGCYDLAFTSLPLSEVPADLEVVPVFKVFVEAVLARDHPLAQHNQLTAAELASATLIGPWRDPYWRQQMDAILPPGMPTPGQTIETHSSLMAYQMASDGAGIAFLDRLSARGLDTGNVVFRPLAAAVCNTFGYIHPRGRSLGNNAIDFLAAIRATVIEFRAQNRENENAAMLLDE